MSSGAFGRAWMVIFATALVLGIYPLAYEQTPWLQSHFRTYELPFWSPATADSLTTKDSLEEDANRPFQLYTGWPHLSPFFQKLEEGSEQIRIAYFGDSGIEGDLMTQSLRDSLQTRFGGSGVGFLPITAVSPGFRLSVNHRFSENWESGVIGQADSSGIPYGINGHWYRAIHADTASADSSHDKTSTFRPWVRYTGTSRFSHTRTFPRLRLFFRALSSDSVARERPTIVSLVCHEDTTTYALPADTTFQMKWLRRSPCSRMVFLVEPNKTMVYYGFSAESRSGVLLDNFGLRGNAGGPLLDFPVQTLQQFQDWLDYDLIVFQFGANMLQASRTDFSAYQNEVVQLIRHFQHAIPGVPILVVGLPDKATKVKGKMRTDPSLPRIHRAQLEAARSEGVAFFSFYWAMGGAGSIIRWVEEERPALATSDYTHFTFKGGKRASHLWMDYLLTGYEQYLQRPDSMDVTREITPYAPVQ